MTVWSIADLHLSFGVANKGMDRFGVQWQDHPSQIASHWKSHVASDDIVLIPGDISWAMTLDEVAKDLDWIASLPGQKVLIRGNHDYWWPSLKKLQTILPPSCTALHNNAVTINGVSIGGTRLWDSPYCSFESLYNGSPREPLSPENQKIFDRELVRLEMSLKLLDPRASHRIAMTHYPPISLDLSPNPVSALFERYGVSIVVFGHLHFPKQPKPYFGEARGVRYCLTASDFLDFKPLKLI